MNGSDACPCGRKVFAGAYGRKFCVECQNLPANCDCTPLPTGTECETFHCGCEQQCARQIAFQEERKVDREGNPIVVVPLPALRHRILRKRARGDA